MNIPSFCKSRRHPWLWLSLLTVLAFACTCNLFQALPSATTPSPLPVNNPTYTPYPTYTAYPSNEPPAEEAPPSPTLAPTQQLPAPQPTSTHTELPPPPGGGSWGISKSDIEVLKVASSSTTGPGTLYVDIRNNGPKEFSGELHVGCSGMAYVRSDLSLAPVQPNSNENITITIGLGTGFFYTSLRIDPVSYIYPVIQCVIEVPDDRDPDTSNNSGTLNIP